MVNLILLSIAGGTSGLAQILSKRLALKGHMATSCTAVTMWLATLVSLPLLLFQFRLPQSGTTWILVIISVAAFAITSSLSYKAYKHEDVSVVSIIQRFSTVITAFLAIVFLHEQYSANNYLGLFLIFIGCVVLAFNKDMKIKLSLGMILAFLSAGTGSLASVLDKVILNDFAPFTYVFVNNLLTGLVLSFHKQTFYDSSILLKNHYKLLLAIATLMTFTFAIITFVLQKTNASQTIPVYKGLALLIPVIIGVTFLHEKTRVGQKVAGVCCVLFGIYLLS